MAYQVKQYIIFRKIQIVNYHLKLTSHGILHYFWSADLSKSSSQLIVSWKYMIVSILTFLNQKLIIFSQYYFNRFVGLRHIAYIVIH